MSRVAQAEYPPTPLSASPRQATTDDQLGPWNAAGKMLGVIALDELIVLAVGDHDQYPNKPLPLRMNTRYTNDVGPALIQL